MITMKKNISSNIDASNFWSSDLSNLEAIFLKEGEKITDLPPKLIKCVPSQGSVLLKKIINIDKVVKKPSFINIIKSLILNK